MDVGRVLTKRDIFRNTAPAKFDAAGRPDFLCIGAQKAGTSWLYHQLNSHPDFWMPPVKELRYFDSLSKVNRRNSPRCKDERDRWFLEKLDQLSSQSHIALESYSALFEA